MFPRTPLVLTNTFQGFTWDPAKGQWYTPPFPFFQEKFIFVNDTVVPYARPFVQRFWIVDIYFLQYIELYAKPEFACELALALGVSLIFF